jgi:predicted nucleic acid-binding Zn ribbon protein
MNSHNNIRFSGLEKIAKNRGYRVDKDGNFYTNNNNLITFISRDGYVRTSLKVNGKNKMLFAHRLQAYQKYGEAIYSKGILVRHLDGDKTNNKVDNIAIGSARDNMMDVPKQVRVERASKAARQTIKHNRDEIIAYYNECGRSRKKVMEKFGITSTGTLHYILNHRKFNDKL